jgi:hypothetical protein
LYLIAGLERNNYISPGMKKELELLSALEGFYTEQK